MTRLFLTAVTRTLAGFCVLAALGAASEASAQEEPPRILLAQQDIDRLENLTGGGARDRIGELEEALADRDAGRTGETNRDPASGGGDESIAVFPEIADPNLLDEEGRAALRRSLTAYYTYRADGFEHRQAVFAWQLFSSKIIFWLVVGLVTAGIYFSWLQFRAALPRQGGEAAPAETTIEATAGGIKVSSPVLGVIILVLSLAFFYLYLVHVYPITEIF